MDKVLYLVRHGIVEKFPRVDYLHKSGLCFAENLHNIIDRKKIDYIAIVAEKKRCEDTIDKIAKSNNLTPDSLTKKQFKALVPYVNSLKYETSIVCYGLREKTELFEKFNIDFQNNTDILYEIIYKVNLTNDTYEEIPTGYSKRNI